MQVASGAIEDDACDAAAQALRTSRRKRWGPTERWRALAVRDQHRDRRRLADRLGDFLPNRSTPARRFARCTGGIAAAIDPPTPPSGGHRRQCERHTNGEATNLGPLPAGRTRIQGAAELLGAVLAADQRL